MFSRELLKKYIKQRIEETRNEKINVESSNINTIQSKINNYYKNEGSHDELLKLYMEIEDGEFDE